MKSGTGTQRRSSLFLIELMISIFFFAIASSVCIQLFARAKQISDESSAKNQALLQAESAASAFYAGDGTLRLIPEVFPEAASMSASSSVTADSDAAGSDAAGSDASGTDFSESSSESCMIFFDKDWKNCAPGPEAEWQMTISVSHEAAGQDAPSFSTAEILVEDPGKDAVLYELQVQYHAPEAADP